MQPAKEGFDQIDRGEGVELRSAQELDEHIDQLGKEASTGSATAMLSGSDRP